MFQRFQYGCCCRSGHQRVWFESFSVISGCMNETPTVSSFQKCFRMFVLTRLSNIVRLAPHEMGMEMQSALQKALNKKLANKVCCCDPKFSIRFIHLHLHASRLSSTSVSVFACTTSKALDIRSFFLVMELLIRKVSEFKS